MCGIAGIVGKNAADHREAVTAMVTAMRHRGPDADGMYQSPSGDCIFGHRRLSILDVSARGAQPMSTEDGRYTLCYNGECYNYRTLRNELRHSGQEIRSDSDTEIVLHMLAKGGEANLGSLNGMFALALWDNDQRKLLLARDRFGQKPLYYLFRENLCIFASEIRAILASGMIDKKLNPDALVSYFAFGAVTGPNTIVKNTTLLGASSYLTWVPSAVPAVRTFWSPPTTNVRCDKGELRDRLSAAVDRHLASDVPIGMFLSGGIDSSAVVAAATKSRQSGLVTLSVTYPDNPRFSEREHARRIAVAEQTTHIEIPMTAESMLQLLPKCLDALDQPTIDGFNTFVVAEAAREANLKVALSGLGGDELFGGYPSFEDIPRVLALKKRLGPCAAVATTLLRKFGPNAAKFRKLTTLLEADQDLLNFYLIRRRLFQSEQVAEFTNHAIGDSSGSVIPNEFEEFLRRFSAGRDAQDAIGMYELFSYMGQTLLRDADAMGMARSLEIRAPFLDTEFTDWALALPPEVRTPHGHPKAWLVSQLGDWIPRENARRPKQGFTMPFASWMRTTLREQITATLTSFSGRLNFVNSEVVLGMWNRFLSHPNSVGWCRPWSLFVLGHYLEANDIA